MKKINQSGFGLWELFLLIILILVFIWLFWYVWQQNKINEESSKPQDGTSQINKKEEKPKEPQISYLEIPEMGIKMQLDDATKDAYYVMKNGYAYLSLESLKNIDECAAEETSIAAISKAKKTDKDELSGMTYAEVAKDNGIVIGEFAYFITPAQAYCTEQPDAKLKNIAAREAFPDLAKSITTL